jgi:hypothetical protein
MSIQKAAGELPTVMRSWKGQPTPEHSFPNLFAMWSLLKKTHAII